VRCPDFSRDVSIKDQDVEAHQDAWQE
jgi:hypothetical protein